MLLKIHQKQWRTGTRSDNEREEGKFRLDPSTVKTLVPYGENSTFNSVDKLWMVDKGECTQFSWVTAMCCVYLLSKVLDSFSKHCEEFGYRNRCPDTSHKNCTVVTKYCLTQGRNFKAMSSFPLLH